MQAGPLRSQPEAASTAGAGPLRTDHLVLCLAGHDRADGRLLKQVIERLALSMVERAEQLVLDC